MKHPSRGFALSELLVVVGVVGILAMLAIPKVKNFIIIAQRAEAKSGTAYATSLINTWVIAQGSAPSTAIMGVADGDVPDASFMVIDADAGCNQTNPVGFAVENCAKARYTFYYHSYGGKKFLVGSRNRAGKSCTAPGGDWVVN